MKFLKKNYLLLLTAVLLLTSCSKDTNNKSSSTGLKKPKKITITDTGGTSQVINFQYEGNNLKKFTINNVPALFEYFYQNGILLEYKETSTSSEKFFYDTTGKLIQILKNPTTSNYFRADFTYNAGSTKINSAKFYRSPTYFWKEITYNYDANGNVSKAMNITYNSFIQRTYDNKNNPFINVNCELEEHDLIKNDWFQSSKNNCLTAIEQSAFGQLGSATFTYTYDNENFPTTRIEKSGSVVKQTITYEY